MPEFTADELKNKTAEQLVILGEQNDPLSAEGILIKNELQRRLLAFPQKTKQWYDKPIGILLIGIVVSLLAAILLYLYGPH